jgi:hypothetical protein
MSPSPLTQLTHSLTRTLSLLVLRTSRDVTVSQHIHLVSFAKMPSNNALIAVNCDGTTAAVADTAAAAAAVVAVAAADAVDTDADADDEAPVRTHSSWGIPQRHTSLVLTRTLPNNKKTPTPPHTYCCCCCCRRALLFRCICIGVCLVFFFQYIGTRVQDEIQKLWNGVEGDGLGRWEGYQPPTQTHTTHINTWYEQKKTTTDHCSKSVCWQHHKPTTPTTTLSITHCITLCVLMFKATKHD